jgi:hypothetical protein
MCGCASTHKASPPPLLAENATVVSVRHFVGTPLSGTVLKEPPPIDPADVLEVEVSFVALEENPSGFDPLGARARLIVASHGANPVRSTGGLTSSATYAVGEQAAELERQIESGRFQRHLNLVRAFGGLPPGVTARFEVTDSGKPQALLPSGLGHRRFQVQISRPEKFLFTRNKAATAPATEPDIEGDSPATQPTTAPATLPATLPTTRPATRPTTNLAPAPATAPATLEIEMAVELDDIAAADAPESMDVKAPAVDNSLPHILHIETVILDPISFDPQAENASRPVAVVVVPFKFAEGRNRSVAAIIRIGRTVGSENNLQVRRSIHLALCQAIANDLHASYIAAKAAAAARPAPSPDEATVNDLLASMEHPQTRRSSAAYIAAWSGARYCEDVVLSADNKTLADLTGQFPAEISGVGAQKPVVGWRLDRLTLRFLLKLQNDGKLPPELAAILSDRAGEAGRHPSAMEEILRDVAGPVDLDQRLVATNRLYLEDSSPASRARAYDWLKNRNRHEEPAGYLPLSPARDRRAALEKDLLDRAAAATRPATQPSGVP